MVIKLRITMKTVVILIFLSSWTSFAAESDSHIAAEVMQQSKELWKLVDNYGDRIKIEVQDKYSEGSDTQYSRLIEAVDEEVLNDDTVYLLDKLIDTYKVSESNSDDLEDFLNEVLDTEVIKCLGRYLNESGEIDDDVFEEKFKRIWFAVYQLEDEEEITGFQRIFMGEFNGTEVLGFNNWVRYYKEEENYAITYQGWTNKIALDKLNLVSVSFLWNNASEAVSTIPFGTKPEYEMAIYTLCWYKMPGDPCHVYMGDNDAHVVIITEVIEYEDKDYIRSANMGILGVTEAAGSSLHADHLFSAVICGCLLFRPFIWLVVA